MSSVEVDAGCVKAAHFPDPTSTPERQPETTTSTGTYYITQYGSTYYLVLSHLLKFLLTLGTHVQLGLRYLVCVCVFVCVKSHLSSGVSLCTTNAATYSVGNRGQNICGVFSETNGYFLFIKHLNAAIFLRQ